MTTSLLALLLQLRNRFWLNLFIKTKYFLSHSQARTSFDLTLHFIKRSFRLIPNARFHGTPVDLKDRSCKLLASKRKKIRCLDSSLIAAG
jgi:hypothetical protein